MTVPTAKTSAMFNNGVTSVEVVDSDNDDIDNERNGMKNKWTPSLKTFRKLFTSSSAAAPSNNKSRWRRRQNKQDADNEQCYDQDDEQDDDSENQELHQQTDEGRTKVGKSRDVEEDDDDDDEDQDEDRQVRKKMLRKQVKKEVEVKKKSKYFQIYYYVVNSWPVTSRACLLVRFEDKPNLSIQFVCFFRKYRNTVVVGQIV